MASGRSLLDVAHESYALTLYMFWHIEQRRWLDAMERRSERIDLAGLMAHSFHEPKTLADIRAAFLARLSPAPASAGDLSRARIIAMINDHHRAGDVTPLPVPR